MFSEGDIGVPRRSASTTRSASSRATAPPAADRPATLPARRARRRRPAPPAGVAAPRRPPPAPPAEPRRPFGPQPRRRATCSAEVMEIKHGRAAMLGFLHVILIEAGVRVPTEQCEAAPAGLIASLEAMPTFAWLQIMLTTCMMESGYFLFEAQTTDAAPGDIGGDAWVRYDDPEAKTPSSSTSSARTAARRCSACSAASCTSSSASTRSTRRAASATAPRRRSSKRAALRGAGRRAGRLTGAGPSSGRFPCPVVSHVTA